MGRTIGSSEGHRKPTQNTKNSFLGNLFGVLRHVHRFGASLPLCVRVYVCKSERARERARESRERQDRAQASENLGLKSVQEEGRGASQPACMQYIPATTRQGLVRSVRERESERERERARARERERERERVRERERERESERERDRERE